MFSPPNLKEEILDVLVPFSIVSVFTVSYYSIVQIIIIIVVIASLMGCTVLGC